MIKLGHLLQHIEFGRTVTLVEHMTDEEIVTFTLSETKPLIEQYEGIEDHLELEVMMISTTPSAGIYLEIM